MIRRIINEEKKWNIDFNKKNQYLILNKNSDFFEIYLFINKLGYYRNVLVKFVLPNDYPFSAPNVYFCMKNITVDYKKTLLLNSILYDEMEKLLKNHVCLCCRTKLCNWCPVINIIDLSNEIKDFLLLKQRLCCRFFFKKIRNKLCVLIPSNDILNYILEFI